MFLRLVLFVGMHATLIVLAVLLYTKVWDRFPVSTTLGGGRQSERLPACSNRFLQRDRECLAQRPACM